MTLNASVFLGRRYQPFYILHHIAAALLEMLGVDTFRKKGKLLQKNAGKRSIF